MILADLETWCMKCYCRKGDKNGHGMCGECWQDWKEKEEDVKPLNFISGTEGSSDGGLAF